MWFATRLRKLMPNKIGVWTRVRTAPKLAPKTMHELIKARNSNQLKNSERNNTHFDQSGDK
jgi:L-lactate dehydrogenase complex protein LldF